MPVFKPIQTERLVLREFLVEDAPFILELLNTEAWLRFIGDRGVRSLGDAKLYLHSGPQKSYTEHGFGLWLVMLNDHTPIGMCGLLKRDTLPALDLGFAFLPNYSGKGYAYEAAQAAISYARQELKEAELLAITDPDNLSSIRLLEKLGFHFEKTSTFGNTSEKLSLFSLSLLADL